MKKWMKFFGLSFFSNKEAEKAPKFGFGYVLLAVLLSMVFFLFGYYASDVLPFGTHYDHASKYKQFVHKAFEDNVQIKIENQMAVADKHINTYTGDADKELYMVNNYNLIVDTRPSDTLIHFDQVAVKGDKEISYEEYKKLNDEAKKEYKLKIKYSDEEMIVTSDMGQSYATYLEKISTETDEDYNAEAKKEYSELKSKQNEYSEEEYNKELYYLHVKYYYSSVKSLFQGAKAPVLRDYYYNDYITAGKAYYFYVFDNLCAGSFETDSGTPIVFGGYYNKCSNGEVANIDSFIKQVYYDTAGYTFASYLISTIALFSTLAIAPLLVALIMWGIRKLVKEGWEKSFVGCYKIVASFIWFSAFLISLALFIGGWFASARALYKLIPITFTAVLVIRTAIFCIVTTLNKRKMLADKNKQDDEIHQFNDTYGGNL